MTVFDDAFAVTDACSLKVFPSHNFLLDAFSEIFVTTPVFEETLALNADLFPPASARTLYLYVVLFARPVNLTDKAEVVFASFQDFVLL